MIKADALRNAWLQCEAVCDDGDDGPMNKDCRAIAKLAYLSGIGFVLDELTKLGVDNPILLAALDELQYQHDDLYEE